MQRAKGFSLIEVLIAIVIFSIGFLAVQKMIIQNISTTDRIKIQTDATMLSTQALQMVYTLRNTNLMKGIPRNCAVPRVKADIADGESCLTPFPTDASQALRLSMKTTPRGGDSNPYFVGDLVNLVDFPTDFEAFKLYAHTGDINGIQTTRYNHDPAGGTPTLYARYVSFEAVNNPNDPGTYFDTGFVLEMHATILFSKASFTGKVIIEGIVGKILD